MVDTPPGHDRLLAKALDHADVVVLPTRVGGVEAPRVDAVLAMIPRDIPVGLVICSARTYTRDYQDLVAAWSGGRGAGVGLGPRAGDDRPGPAGPPGRSTASRRTGPCGGGPGAAAASASIGRRDRTLHEHRSHGDTMTTAKKPAKRAAKTTGRQTAPAAHAADRHEVIRVLGARENNLKDVDIELPKRRLTVFTGVSGSGKSSLAFGTIAAESQRMINETYSAFVQGFMPTLARPEVDVLDGLTTAIIVDQQRMGSDPRSTVGTATDANTMLRILFSRLGEPHIGSPQAFSFNVASISGSGAVTIERGGEKRREKRSFSITGGMCPRCEGRGSVNDFDLTQLYDDSKSLLEGALTVPGYSMEGWYGRIYRGCGFFDPDKPIRKFTKKELHDLLYKEPTKIKVDGVNLTYAGLIPQIQKSFLSKDVDAMQPHIRAFVERVVTFTTCPDCDGSRLERGRPIVEDRQDQHRRRLRDGDPRPRRVGPRSWTSRRWRRCSRRCSTPSTRSWTSGWATSRSTGRRARCRAARPSAPRCSATSAPRSPT